MFFKLGLYILLAILFFNIVCQHILYAQQIKSQACLDVLFQPHSWIWKCL